MFHNLLAVMSSCWSLWPGRPGIEDGTGLFQVCGRVPPCLPTGSSHAGAQVTDELTIPLLTGHTNMDKCGLQLEDPLVNDVGVLV